MKISILTPSFNSSPYLERAIQSVLAQNDPDFEHIVVDGGSKDETVAVLKKYPHLKWVSEADQGQPDAMNKAFAMSTGGIVTYLNADDWFEPGTFAHVRELFSGHSDADILVGNLYVRYADSHSVRLIVPVKTYRGILLDFRGLFPLNPVGYFYRRRVQDWVGKFPLHLHYAMDYWFLLRAFSKFCAVPSDLVFGTFFITGKNKTCRRPPADEKGEILTEHLQDNPQMRFFFYRHWWWHQYIRHFPERVKEPLRYLAYKVLFAPRVDYSEFKALGFRKCWRNRFSQR